MKTDQSMASFWHAYTADEKATHVLTGKTEPLAPDPMVDTVNADESPVSSSLEVIEYHP